MAKQSHPHVVPHVPYLQPHHEAPHQKLPNAVIGRVQGFTLGVCD